MGETTKPNAPVSISGAIIMPYRYAAGNTGSRFFIALRDNKKIMGTRCPYCNHVYVPPKSTCLRCFAKLNEWIELDGKGTLESFTVVSYSLPVHPMKSPFALGLIKLDGADTSLAHLLGEIDFNKLRIGMRLEPVFRERRNANILDIKYFRPITGGVGDDAFQR